MVLQQMQELLERTYDVPLRLDVAQFLLTDRNALPAEHRGAATDEQVLVAADSSGVALGLFLDPDVLSRLAAANPLDALTGDNLADCWTALEGVSHFVYLAWNARHDRAVSLLELELQAEIDKYVVSLALLRAQDPSRFPRELHRALFESARVCPALAGDRVGLYRRAHRYAARFCRHIGALLEPFGSHAQAVARAELRRFYRLASPMKQRHIECLA